jgi:hypothetical protein
MGSKSRRNRQKIQAVRRVENTSPAPSTVSSKIVQTEKTASQSRPGKANLAAAYPSYPYVLSEIKWISIVAGIIIAILLILYFLLH